MGNDGGSIPTRRELVKEAARNPTTSELRATVSETLAHRWSHCFLTDLPLQPPVASDALGRLFNKSSVLEFILAANADDETSETRRREGDKRLKGTVQGLKDVVEVRFASEDDGKSWFCPVTQKKLDENTRAVYVVPCGHAFSEAAVKETMGAAVAAVEKGDALEKPKCLQCNEAYASNDVIPILPTNDMDIARLRLRADRLKEIGLAHSLRKLTGGKKRKNNEELERSSKDGALEKERKKSNGRIHDATTASITAKVLGEQSKKRRVEQNENLQSLYSQRKSDGKSGQNNDFMTRGYSLPANHGG